MSFLLLASLPVAGLAQSVLSSVPTKTAHPGLAYYLTGNGADVQTKTEAGYVLIGGAKDQDSIFRWFLKRANGGDLVVLRASGADGYNPYLTELGGLDSVESLVVSTAEAARDPFVEDKIRHAEALFLAGGDQWNYVRLWRNTPVSKAIQSLIDRGVPVGGTSAGLAVLGQYVFNAEHDTVTSEEALANPFGEKVTLGSDFLRIPALDGIITDSHFHARDRMGRTLVFLARILEEGKLSEARAIAIDERTAALAKPNGQMEIDGVGFVYFVRARRRAGICRPGTPLTFGDIEIYRVPKGGSFDVKAWKGQGGTAYRLDVENGLVRSSQPGGSIY